MTRKNWCHDASPTSGWRIRWTPTVPWFGELCADSSEGLGTFGILIYRYMTTILTTTTYITLSNLFQKLSQAPSLPQKKPPQQPSNNRTVSHHGDRTPSSISNQAPLASTQHLPGEATGWKGQGPLPHLSKWRRQPWLWANMLRSGVGHLHSCWQNVVTSPASPNFCQVAFS